MTFKEYLISQGIKDDQAAAIEAGMAEHKLYISENENIDTRYNKTKDLLDQSNTDLQAANDLISKLQKQNKDNEDLQNQVATYKTQAEEAESKRAETVKEYAIKDALRDAGAKDVDYMMFKLGEVEVDKDGNIKDLDSKVKDLKEASPDFFAVADNGKDGDGKEGDKGYKPLDNGLEGGNGSDDPESAAQADFEAALGLKN